MRRCLAFLIVAAAGRVALEVIFRLRLVLLPLVAAVMIASVLRRPRRFLVDRGWPPLAASWTLFIVGTLLIAGAAWITIPPIVTEAASLGTLTTSGVNKVQAWLSTSHFGLSAAQVQQYLGDLRQQLAGPSGSIFGGIVSDAAIAGEFVVGVLLASVLTFFILQDQEVMIAWAGKHAPAVGDLSERIQATLARYMEAASMNGIVIALLTAGLLVAMQVPLVMPLAALTFLSTFLPLVGPVVVGVLAGLVALGSGGISTALIVVGGTIIIHILEGSVIYPLVFRRGLHLHGAAIVLALAAGTAVAGLVGAALAVPTLAITVEIVAWSKERRSSDDQTS